ncbi:hypothetical protein CRYUN_Cryun18bG0059000 [Craigia yunnanensis]
MESLKVISPRGIEPNSLLFICQITNTNAISLSLSTPSPHHKQKPWPPNTANPDFQTQTPPSNQSQSHLRRANAISATTTETITAPLLVSLAAATTTTLPLAGLLPVTPAFAALDDEEASNSWVAKYRKEKALLGRVSFRDTYSALSAVSGHYISFGPTAPIPAKRKAGILEEMDTAEKALLRGR